MTGWPYPLWIAHRGAGKLAPENTLAAFCLRNGHALNIEIKPTPGTEAATGRMVASEAARLWSGAAVLPLLSSFEPDALRAAQAAAPELPRALLLDSLRTGWFDEARALGCAGIVTNYAVMDAAVLAQAHAAGLRALVYTVNDPAEVLRLVGMGIDGIITDAVDRFSPAP